MNELLSEYSESDKTESVQTDLWLKFMLAQNINRAPLRLLAPTEFGARAVRCSIKIFGALTNVRLLPPLWRAMHAKKFLELEHSSVGALWSQTFFAHISAPEHSGAKNYTTYNQISAPEHSGAKNYTTYNQILAPEPQISIPVEFSKKKSSGSELSLSVLKKLAHLSSGSWLRLPICYWLASNSIQRHSELRGITGLGNSRFLVSISHRVVSRRQTANLQKFHRLGATQGVFCREFSFVFGDNEEEFPIFSARSLVGERAW
ncbi:hypothetical protein ACFE04_019848 [Oxalis oulophora]